MTGVADVDGFKISIQVCAWPRFPPLKVEELQRGENTIAKSNMSVKQGR